MGRILAHLLVQASGLSFLIPDDMEAGTTAAVQGRRHHKQGGRFHLTGLDSQALPGLPPSLQFIINRRRLRAVLAVKAVFILHHTDVQRQAQPFDSLHQAASNRKIRRKYRCE